MAVSKRLRYEILQRDGYTCRYCGAKADNETRLVVDHVLPKALGGKDEPDNLITACEPCNVGKSSTTPGLDLVADVAERHGLHQSALHLWGQVNDRATAEFNLALPECHCIDYCGDPLCRLVFAAYMSGFLDKTALVNADLIPKMPSEVTDGTPLGAS
ncbi:hypothetical protein CH276_22605 [Rhodococcus sp. 06-470-2]|uniref:HNH endonuclease n=1 Tax=unclassified Rhodococcus (in: high G+C Gram-positive bacteria) TaxID=192944 RepID=UPI000B9B8701|nr:MULTISPECIES: HNH endonuclease [unclassified Rhodococcus (in: high G+C Gram-positive bacteria)]OZC59242.1 hypothetical protein CH276_22605 [Rhodococcus sp. 06-470-2]OZE66829.1 hypothetical protein CH265_07930 [Rhodococcus sp. 05-2221-1B]